MASKRDIKTLTGKNAEFRWNWHAETGEPVVITYSFGSSKAKYEDRGYKGYQSWTEAHKNHVRQALETWEESAGVTFVEVPDSQKGDIRFAMVDLTGLTNAVGNQVSGFGYFPGRTFESQNGRFVQTNAHNTIGGDIFLNSNFYAADPGTIAPGVRGYSIIIHEIGHALGFKHPFEGTPTIAPEKDNGAFTVLSYDRPHSTTQIGTIDKAAMEYLYGPDADSINAKWLNKKKILQQKADGKSNDIAGTHLKDSIDLGGGPDRGLGLANSDTIKGGAGKDTLNGGDRDDKLYGNGQNDRLFGERGSDTLDGGTGSDNLYGGEGRDTLLGGGGNDTLKGGRGKDWIDGGPGSDVLYGDDFGGEADTFVFRKGDGKDTIKDFEVGLDKIRFLSGAKNEDDLVVKENGDGDVVIFYDGGKITLENVSLFTLGSTDIFEF